MDNILLNERESKMRPGQRLGFALYRIGRAVAQTYEAELAPLEVLPAHAGILSAIAYEGPLHIRALSRLLGINRQSIVNGVDRLEARGAVTRTTASRDGRLALVSLSPAGKRLLGKIEQRVRAFDGKIEGIGTIGQRNAVLWFLNELAQSGAVGDSFHLLPERADPPGKCRGSAALRSSS